jgi:hypothetical protein
VRPSRRKGMVWVNGRDVALRDLVAGRVPGVSLIMPAPDVILVNGQPISGEQISALGIDLASLGTAAGMPPGHQSGFRGRGPPPGMPPGGGGPPSNLPPWIQKGGRPPDQVR